MTSGGASRRCFPRTCAARNVQMIGGLSAAFFLHVLKSGCRWCDCPPEYGPSTTIYNRFVLWALPDVLDRIEFRRVGWQAEKRDVVRRIQSVAGVPAGAVEHEDGVG